MILVDTSVIVAWLDKTHPQHQECVVAIERCASPAAGGECGDLRRTGGGRTHT